MTTFKQFEDIEAWRLARSLSRELFEESVKGPLSRDFRLKDQINAASGSVMHNIAEGFGRGSKNEFALFLGYAIGSCNEVKSQLYCLLDRNYIEQVTFDAYYFKAEEIIGKTGRLVQYLNGSPVKGIRSKGRK